MRPTLSLRWLRRPQLPRLSRWSVAGIFTLGSVNGMLLMHCAEPPPPRSASESALDCQGLVFAEFIGDHPRILHGEAFTIALAQDLVRSIRRCAGQETNFDDSSNDPFGIGGAPGPLDSDAGRSHDIYRSLP